MPYLSTTIKSHVTGKVYGEINEEVNIISLHGDVAIVQGKCAFPVRAEFLSDDRVVVEQVEGNKKERKKPESRKALTQAEKLQIEYLNSLK